jgi:hypothetical protein
VGTERIDIPIDLTPVLVGVVRVGDLIEDFQHPQCRSPAGVDFVLRKGDHASGLGIESSRGEDIGLDRWASPTLHDVAPREHDIGAIRRG